MELFLYHSQATTFARGPGKMNESMMIGPPDNSSGVRQAFTPKPLRLFS